MDRNVTKITIKIYEVKQIDGKWCVVRPDGSKVNEAEHATREQAQRQLNYLIAYKFCAGE